MTRPRIVITIDRIVVDRKGLTREALAAALAAEVRRRIEVGGASALGASRSIESATGPRIVSRQTGDDASAIAHATLGALGR